MCRPYQLRWQSEADTATTQKIVPVQYISSILLLSLTDYSLRSSYSL